MSFAPSAAGRTMLVVLAFVCVIRTQAANAATYTWNGGASAAWTNAASWSPARNSPATSDVLQFTGGGTTTATSVPTQTIGQLTVSNNTTLTLQQVSNATLTIAGGSGVDLSVAAGSSLSAGPNFGPLHVFIGAGATADIFGTLSFPSLAHTLDAADANGVTFESGALCSAVTPGAVFTTGGTANAIHFLSGSTLSVCCTSPFGLAAPNSKIVLDHGSLFIDNGYGSTDLSGRTFGNYRFNATGGFTGSPTGSGTVSMDSLSVTAGTLNLGTTGAFNVRGAISVSGGAALAYVPASAATMTLNGTVAQRLTATGAFSVGGNGTIQVNNANGVTLFSDWTIASGTLNLANGRITTGANTLAVLGTANLTGAGIGTGWVIGKLKRTVLAPGARTFDLGTAANYLPVQLQVNGLAAGFDLTASTTALDHPQLSSSQITPTKSVNRYWTLTPASAPTFSDYAVTFAFPLGEVDGGSTPANFRVAKYTGAAWTTLTAGTRTATTTQAVGVTSFSDFAIGETATSYFVGGQVFDDRNGNGTYDPASNPPETGFGNRTVESLDPADNVLATSTTDSLGAFQIGIACGSPYRVRIVTPDGWSPSNGPPNALYSGPAQGCGSIVAIVFQGYFSPPCRDTTRTYTTTPDFGAPGVLDGLVASGDKIELIQNPTTNNAISKFAWIANSAEGTVSKVSTETGKEVARYYTGPPIGLDYSYLSPSRTVVDKDGNCWVANRAFGHQGSITEILNDGGQDRDCNGIKTSTDANADGKIVLTSGPPEIYPWGQDERVVRHYQVGPSTFPYGVPRALSFDRSGMLWVGLNGNFTALGGVPALIAVDPNLPLAACPTTLTPTTISSPPTVNLVSISYGSTTATLFPYGLALGPNGMLYGSTASGYAFEVDPVAKVVTKFILGDHSNYGIAVDKNCIVWLAEVGANHCVRWDPSLTTDPTTGWAHNSGGAVQGRGRGITVGTDGRVWMANDTANGVSVFKSDGTLDANYSFLSCGPPCNTNTKIGYPVGVGVAYDGNIILSGQQSWSWLKVNQSTGAVMPLGPQLTGMFPYTYSDFTGSLQNITAQTGFWTVITDSKQPAFKWTTVNWTATTPASTSVTVEARASDDLASFQPSSSVAYTAASGALTPALHGRYIQTRARLVRAIDGCNAPFVTPSLLDLTVIGECDSCMMIGCPRDTTIPCTSPAGAIYNYKPPIAAGKCSVNTYVTCSPPPGSQFPIGTTQVSCVMQIPGGASVPCSFSVTVTGDCVATPTGACCFSGRLGGCQTLTQGECEARGGTYLGDNQPCLPRCREAGCVAPPAGLRAWWPFDAIVSGFTPNYADPGVPGSVVGPPSQDPVSHVHGSLAFAGSPQSVVAPDAPSVEFGTGDLSIDAWVLTSQSSGYAPILDKRDPDPPHLQGYHLFLQDGYPGLQLAVNGSATNFILDGSNGGPLAACATGTWRHVTVAVKRNSATGIQFYVNGQPRGSAFSSIPANGNLNNSVQLFIGKSQPYLAPSAYFNGKIDEVELFNRQLTAPEAYLVANADTAGKCREACYVPSNVACCRGAGSTGVTICNYSDAAHLYSWGVQSSLGAKCASITQATFSPPSGSVTVPAHSCVFVPFTIACPTGMKPGDSACFTVSLYNHETGRTFGCTGSVRGPLWWCLDWRTDVNLPAARGLYPLDRLTAKLVKLHGDFDAAVDLPPRFKYRLRAVAGESDTTASEAISINGLAAGAVFEDSIVVSPSGGSFDIPVTLAYQFEQPLEYDRVLVEAVDDPSGEFDVVGELAVRDSIPPSAVAVPPPVATDVPEVQFLALPNPFSTSTRIRFSLPTKGEVSLAIYDVKGRAVMALLHEEEMDAGPHDVEWDGRDRYGDLLPSGVYFIRLALESGDTHTARMVLRH